MEEWRGKLPQGVREIAPLRVMLCFNREGSEESHQSWTDRMLKDGCSIRKTRTGNFRATSTMTAMRLCALQWKRATLIVQTRRSWLILTR